MGYDLHITRKCEWSDEEGPVITEGEWRNIIAGDSELALDTETICDEYVFATWNGERGALAYHDGEITGKNPENPLIWKMVRIAKMFGAHVQGDDGEICREDGSSLYPQGAVSEGNRSSLLSRIASWFGPKQAARGRQNIPAFSVGQRVKNVWGDLGTITAVDRHARAGLGRLCVRLDDGREQDLAYIA
jgi:hypothetical protein